MVSELNLSTISKDCYLKNDDATFVHTECILQSLCKPSDISIFPVVISSVTVRFAEESVYRS